jgi:hypothetical protein
MGNLVWKPVEKWQFGTPRKWDNNMEMGHREFS